MATMKWRGIRLFLLFLLLGLQLTWMGLQHTTILGENDDNSLRKASWSIQPSKNPLASVLSLPPLVYRPDYPSPVKDLLKIYVYESLPDEIGRNVEDELYQYYRNGTDNNWKAELALLQLFRSFPGRTWDPHEADIFVVPYLHAGHCLVTVGWNLGCRHVRNDLFKEQLFSNLQYWNETTKSRHLLLALAGQDHTHKRIRENPLLLTAGPLVHCSTGPLTCSQEGHILVSQWNDASMFQPSNLLSASYWNDNNKKRKYAFTSHYGEMNAAMRGKSARKYRRFFRWDMMNRTQVGGMPFLLSKLEYGGGNWKEEKSNVYAQYQDSIFCPILSGDMPWQRRFYDAIMSGCIPVVLAWTMRDGNTSWYAPETASMPTTFSLQQTYPFARGLPLWHNDPLLEIDYPALALECPGNETHETDVSSLRLRMEDLILHHPDEITRLQKQLQQTAVAFSFGLGSDAHRYNDQFARIIRALRQHVDRL